MRIQSCASYSYAPKNVQANNQAAVSFGQKKQSTSNRPAGINPNASITVKVATLSAIFSLLLAACGGGGTGGGKGTATPAPTDKPIDLVEIMSGDQAQDLANALVQYGEACRAPGVTCSPALRANDDPDNDKYYCANGRSPISSTGEWEGLICVAQPNDQAP